jgi:CBS domain-containing protein
MKTVQDLLQTREKEIYSVNSSQTVYQALVLMAERNVGALMVMEEKKLVGIISERDYARKVILQGASSLETPVKKIMTERIISVTPQHDLEDCMNIMCVKHIRLLPVMVQDELVGLLSIGDLVKIALEQKDRMIELLTSTAENT